MKKIFTNAKVLSCLFPVITIILELLPYGAVLNFGIIADDGTVEYLRQTYSYFSLTPFGYANFAPLVTAILTCALLAVAVYSAVKSNNRAQMLLIFFSLLTAAVSLWPLKLGYPYYTLLSGAISLLLFAEIIVAIIVYKKEIKLKVRE